MQQRHLFVGSFFQAFPKIYFTSLTALTKQAGRHMQASRQKKVIFARGALAMIRSRRPRILHVLTSSLLIIFVIAMLHYRHTFTLLDERRERAN